jgi:BASS family bile acid:Na+ symporter
MTAEKLMNILTIVTLFEMTIAMGLELRFSEMVAIAKDWRLVLRAEIANFVLQPAASAVLIMILQPSPKAAAAIILLAACPAAHYAMPFTKIGKGNLAAATGLLVILAASTVVLAPFVLGVLLPHFSGGEPVHVPADHVIATLVLIVLLPLAIGMATRALRPALADRLLKPATRLSVLLNVAMIGTILFVQGHQLAQIRGAGYAAMVLLAVVALAIGWLMGGPRRENRVALAQNTALRNMGPGLVIATGQFAGTAVVPVIVAATLANGFAAILAALWWGRGVASNATQQCRPLKRESR